MEYIVLGNLNKTFGLKGEVRCFSLTDFPKLRFKKGHTYFLHDKKSDERVEVTLNSFRDEGRFYVVSFKEFASIEQIEEYLGWDIEIDKEKAPMPKDSYRFFDLIGSTVLDKDGNVLGEVKDVLEYSVTKTLRVKREGSKDFFVPFHKSFIKDVDIESKKIVIEVIEGLL